MQGSKELNVVVAELVQKEKETSDQCGRERLCQMG